MAYPTNPTLQQNLMQLEQEYAAKRNSLMQSFYAQQNNGWATPAQPVTAPPPAPVQNVSWIPVNGLQGAKEHQVPANATHWLMDSNDSVFYVKSADEFGVSKQMKAFRFSEMDLTAPPVSNAPELIDTSMYVQRSEFDELKAKIDQLTSATVNSTSRKPAKTAKEDVDNG